MAIYTPSRTVKTFWDQYMDIGMGIPVTIYGTVLTPNKDPTNHCNVLSVRVYSDSEGEDEHYIEIFHIHRDGTYVL